MDIDWYKRKLSPLENKEFTAKFCAREDREWERTQRGNRQGNPAIVLRLHDLWVHTFNSVPTKHDLMTLAHTLLALGWERTRRAGLTYFVMELKEFDNEYRR